jgi:hypothetical protein
MKSYLDDLNQLYVEQVNINSTTEHGDSFQYAPKNYREDAEEPAPLHNGMKVKAIHIEVDMDSTTIESVKVVEVKLFTSLDCLRAVLPKPDDTTEKEFTLYMHEAYGCAVHAEAIYAEDVDGFDRWCFVKL